MFYYEITPISYSVAFAQTKQNKNHNFYCPNLNYQIKYAAT